MAKQLFKEAICIYTVLLLFSTKVCSSLQKCPGTLFVRFFFFFFVSQKHVKKQKSLSFSIVRLTPPKGESKYRSHRSSTKTARRCRDDSYYQDPPLLPSKTSLLPSLNRFGVATETMHTYSLLLHPPVPPPPPS